MVKCIYNIVGSNSEAYSYDSVIKYVEITDIKPNPA